MLLAFKNSAVPLVASRLKSNSFNFLAISVINFLLSDYSEAITGEIIHVDGGVHAIGGSMLPE